MARQEAAKKAAQESQRAQTSNPSSAGSNNSSGSEPSNSSSPTTEGSWETFNATAYTAYCVGCSGVTRLGIDLRANPDAKVVAVDPNVIPLGSRVEVKGYGVFLAADTGGAIVGKKIDIFMPNRSDALAFGRRSVQVRVLD
nr:3D domain-containing protein [Evansella tamaricis]